MRPTAALMEEHRVIERGLHLLEKASEMLEMGEDVQPTVLEKLLDFIRGFADRCHHQKEEDILFPYLEKWGMPREMGPIGVMLAEHDVGRGHVQGMAEAIKNGQPKSFVAHAEAYITLLKDHIAKEDNVLFPMADQIIDASEAEALFEDFEEVEANQGEAHQKYVALVEELEAAL